MAQTSKNNIYYNDNYDDKADVLADMKKLAESVDTAVENAKYNDSNITARVSTLETDNTTNKKDISDLKEENETQETSIEELQENLSDAQQEIEALKTIQNALPTVDDEGENVKLVGTAENVTFKKFGICGNSRQETREGYNLIDIVNSSLMGQDKGVTIEISDDGYITANGTPTTAYTVFISKNVTNLLEDGQTYSIWQENYSDNDLGEIYSQIMANPVSGSSSTQQFFTSGKNRKTFTVDKSNYTYTWNIQIATLSLAGIFDNYKNRYMLYKGTDNKEKFELYGAMPSPGFSSKIETVGDDTNQFNKDEVVLKDGYYSSVDGSFVTSTTTCHTENYIEVISNANHILSGFKRHSSSYNYPSIYAIYFYDNEKNWISRTSVFYASNSAAINEYLEYQFKTPENCRYIRFQCQTTEIDLDLDKIKLQEGTIATAYSKFGQGTANATVCNKNLFDKNNYVKIYNGLIKSTGIISSEDTRHKTVLIKCKPNMQLSAYIKNKTKASSNLLACFDEMPILDETKATAVSINPNGLQITTTEKTKYLAVYLGATFQEGWTSTQDIIDSIMLVEGTADLTPKDYIEHQEQNSTMPVQREMLEEDYFDLDTLEEVHNWNEIDISTLLSKDIAIGSASTDEYYVFQIPLCSETQRAKEVLCEKFKFLGFETASISRKEEGITINTDAKRFGRVWIKASRLSEKSITAFLNWCSEENIIVKVLIEDVEERLPMTSEQIEIAKQIKNTLVSYKDTTHVYSEDKISPIFKCSAIADMTAMLNNLQAQILANEEV